MIGQRERRIKLDRIKALEMELAQLRKETSEPGIAGWTCQ
jgi:hypothetical protein